METETETKRRRLIEDDSEFLLVSDIITEILSRLPADSALGCRCICKQWRSLIDQPSFRDTHTRQVISSSTSNPKQFGGNSSSSFGFFLCAVIENRRFQHQFVKYIDHGEELVLEFKPCKPITDNPFPFYNNFDNWATLLISSCNGLVFMGSTKPNYIEDMFICNPFTREYVNLCIVPAEERQRRLERKGFMAYGFGYLPSTNEYKIVSIYYPYLNGAYYPYPDLNGVKGEVSVYTIGSGRWRNKGEIPYCVYTELQTGVFVNGAIHWIGKMEEIVTFDLANEKFKVVVPLLPRALSVPSNSFDDELGVLGGCLCVTRSYNKRNGLSNKDIWVLNVNNKDAEEEQEELSWNKRFSIQLKKNIWAEPHAILKSGKILLGGGYSFISYDPKTGASNEDNLRSVFSNNYKNLVIPYTKSFVSLKALGEEDAKCFGGGFVPMPLHSQRSSNNRGNCFGAGHTRTF